MWMMYCALKKIAFCSWDTKTRKNVARKGKNYVTLPKCSANVNTRSPDASLAKPGSGTVNEPPTTPGLTRGAAQGPGRELTRGLIRRVRGIVIH